MGEFEIQCNNCGWQGYLIELVSKTDNPTDKDFIFCPDCCSSDIENIDNEDE